jgi:hypothetical protein
MPENIQVNDGNFSLGPEAGFFYTVDKNLDALLKVEADGDVVDTYFVTLSQLRNPVTELHYDGTFFWTLETLPSDLGVVIKKWRLYPFKTAAFPSVSPSEFRWQDEMTLLNMPNIIYQSEAFAIEHYHRAFDSSALVGDSTIRIDDLTDIDIGDTLYLGPSSFGGFVGNEESILVTGINTTTNRISFTKLGGLENSFTSTDPIDFSKSIWLFNDHSYSGEEDYRGTLQKYEYPSKEFVLSDVGARYSQVAAADFDQTRISFVRGFSILTLNPPASFDLESSLVDSNLLHANRYDSIKVYDLISDLDNNIYYKLQREETNEDANGNFTTDVFADGKYSFQVASNIPFVNSTAMEFQPTRFSITDASPKTSGFTVFAHVRDQFNFPVLGESVQFTAQVKTPPGDPGLDGGMSPSVDFTNASGIATSVYQPSTTPIDLLMDITAEVL